LASSGGCCAIDSKCAFKLGVDHLIGLLRDGLCATLGQIQRNAQATASLLEQIGGLLFTAAVLPENVAVEKNIDKRTKRHRRRGQKHY
jgi:hypothetical protein